MIILIGILYNDAFGVINGIKNLMQGVGDGGLAGLVALILVALWYKK